MKSRTGLSWFEDYLAAWNTRRADTVATWMSEDVSYTDAALRTTLTGRAAVAAFVDRGREFAPDYLFEPISLICNGERYSGEWVWTGTQTGEGLGLEAAGRHFRISGVSVGHRAGDGTIHHNTDYWNLSDLLGQLNRRIRSEP